MVFAALLVVLQEAEEAPPLIDLDGTVFVQFGLFLLMLLILSRFLFKPYLRLRDERAKNIEGARHDAHQMEQSAHQIVADYDAKMTRAKQRGGEERARLRQEAATRERQVLGAAREESSRVLEGAKSKVRTQAETAKRELDAQATVLARQMAQKLLGREVA